MHPELVEGIDIKIGLQCVTTYLIAHSLRQRYIKILPSKKQGPGWTALAHPTRRLLLEIKLLFEPVPEPFFQLPLPFFKHNLFCHHFSLPRIKFWSAWPGGDLNYQPNILGFLYRPFKNWFL